VGGFENYVLPPLSLKWLAPLFRNKTEYLYGEWFRNKRPKDWRDKESNNSDVIGNVESFK